MHSLVLFDVRFFSTPTLLHSKQIVTRNFHFMTFSIKKKEHSFEQANIFLSVISLRWIHLDILT